MACLLPTQRFLSKNFTLDFEAVKTGGYTPLAYPSPKNALIFAVFEQNINMTTTENQNDNNMETTTENKSITISLMEGTEKLVMAIINKNKLAYQLLGRDQNNAAILQIEYSEDQQSIIKDICNAAKFLEILAGWMGLALIAACHEFSGGDKQSYEQLKNKQATDGNQKGE